MEKMTVRNQKKAEIRTEKYSREQEIYHHHRQQYFYWFHRVISIFCFLLFYAYRLPVSTELSFYRINDAA